MDQVKGAGSGLALGSTFGGPIGGAIGGGLGLLGSFFGRGSRRSKAQNFAQGEIQSQAKTQSALGRETAAAGRGMLSAGSGPLAQVLRYYSESLGAGGRGKLMQAMAPEQARITDLYGGASRSAQAGMARGGIQQMIQAEIERKKTGALGTSLMAGRANAADKLGGLSLATTGQGFQGLESAGGINASVMQTLLGMIQEEGANKRAGRAAYGDLGGGVANIILPWILGKYGGGGDKGTSGIWAGASGKRSLPFPTRN